MKNLNMWKDKEECALLQRSGSGSIGGSDDGSGASIGVLLEGAPARWEGERKIEEFRKWVLWLNR